MKILVVGANGFIGSKCVSYFSDQGYNVVGCDLQPTSECINYIDLNDLSYNYNELFSKYVFDVCINSAGSAHVAYSFQYPEKDFELNVFLIINLLGAIKNHSVNCKFINFSSAAIYGNPWQLPIKEEFLPSPISPYGYHKLLSENLLYEYYRFFNLKTCSLRVFSAYGEGLKKQLFWDLYLKANQTDKIELYGTGKESRDFIYIHDLITIVDIIIKKGKFEGETYNVANGEEILIKDAVALFLNELGWNGKVVFSNEEKTGDPINWKADIKKITDLGYQRKYSLTEGLKNYSEWLKRK